MRCSISCLQNRRRQIPKWQRMLFLLHFFIADSQNSSHCSILISHLKEAPGSSEWIMSMRVPYSSNQSVSASLFTPLDVNLTKYMLKPEGKHSVVTKSPTEADCIGPRSPLSLATFSSSYFFSARLHLFFFPQQQFGAFLLSLPSRCMKVVSTIHALWTRGYTILCYIS